MKKGVTQEQAEEVLGVKFPTTGEGSSFEIRGFVNPNKGDIYLDSNAGWLKASCSLGAKLFTLRKITPAPPTSIQDLLGEDGQKNLFLHTHNSSMFAHDIRLVRKSIFLNNSNIPMHISEGTRWSHKLTTPFEEANEFIV